jgi:hypothetical protein
MKANQNTTSTIAEKDAGLAQGTLLHPAKPSGDGSFVREIIGAWPAVSKAASAAREILAPSHPSCGDDQACSGL